jgi:hypothetical protein
MLVLIFCEYNTAARKMYNIKNYLRLYLRFYTVDGALDKLRICTVTGMTPKDKGQSTPTGIFCV